MRHSLAAAFVLLGACSSDSGPTLPATPQGLASADLRLNAQESGTFACSGGLFFVTSVLNQTSAPISVDTITLTFTRVSGTGCTDHAAPISPRVAIVAPPGVSTEIRRVDLAGDLCSSSHGQPGCEWLARVTLGTPIGTLRDEIGFHTTEGTAAQDPEPPVTPPGNNAPRVSLAGGGSCHPSPSRSCSVEFLASFSDPDGDSVTLTWSGCASGNGTRATCVVTSPGPHTARVEASDGRGGIARASANAEGTNVPPVVRIGGPRPPNPAPSNTLYLLTGGQPTDPDGDEEPNVMCRTATLSASGPCRALLALCGGVADAFDGDVRTLAGPGTCVVEATVRDSWGAVGTDRLVFAVSAP